METDKDLLLKDLCARLPYNTKVYAQNEIDWYDSEICTVVIEDCINGEYVIKPYLFPLSSMTEGQKEEYCQLQQKVIYNSRGVINIDITNYVDWLNKNHFDYRGLIEKSLALDATNLGIYE